MVETWKQNPSLILDHNVAIKTSRFEPVHSQWIPFAKPSLALPMIRTTGDGPLGCPSKLSHAVGNPADTEAEACPPLSKKKIKRSQNSLEVSRERPISEESAVGRAPTLDAHHFSGSQYLPCARITIKSKKK